MLQPLSTSRQIWYQQNRMSDPVGKGYGSAVQPETAKTGLTPDQTVPTAAESQGHGTEKYGSDSGKKGDFDTYECQTCANRKYQDGSDDPGVSFKTPTTLSPEKAASAVRSHEYEHVNREQAKAERENRNVVSQSVTYHSAICPECGKVYIAGGTTRTVTKADLENTYNLKDQKQEGGLMDLTA